MKTPFLAQLTWFIGTNSDDVLALLAMLTVAASVVAGTSCLTLLTLLTGTPFLTCWSLENFSDLYIKTNNSLVESQ